MAKLYTCWGSVRGGCGHAHRTLAGAEKCLRHDQQRCRQQGGYSDRAIRVIDTREEVEHYDVTRGPGRPLALEEAAEEEF